MSHSTVPKAPEELDDDMLDQVQGAGDYSSAVTSTLKTAAKGARTMVSSPKTAAKNVAKNVAGGARDAATLLGDAIAGGGGRDPKSRDDDDDHE